MIGLDTNVLLRYLLKDDAAQWAAVHEVFRVGVKSGERFLVNTIVLCELAWVLESRYGWKGPDIAAAMERILATDGFDFEHSHEALEAVLDCRSSKAGFADALIGRINRSLSADHTLTFDRDLRMLDTFHVL